MPVQCSCRTIRRLDGAPARRYLNRYLLDVADANGERRLLHCRSCGAYWEAEMSDALSEDGPAVAHLARVRSSAILEDWSNDNSEDRL